MNNKKIITVLILIVSFWAITAFYFSPLFEGKQVKQHDINMYRGGAKELKDYKVKTGKEGIWTNRMFSGMPAYLNGTGFKKNIFYYLEITSRYAMPYPASSILFAMISAFILLLSFRVNVYVAFLGSIGFALASFMMISLSAGHNGKVVAIGYIPLAMAGMNYFFQNKLYLGVLFTTLGIGMLLHSGHYQIVYYAVLIYFVFGLYLLIDNLKDKRTVIIASVGILISGLLGVLPNVQKVLSVNEYSPYSIRGKSELKSEKIESTGLDRDYAFAWSQGLSENFTFFTPYLFGGASGEKLDEKSNAYEAFIKRGAGKEQALSQLERMPMYWGGQSFTAGPIYLGALLCYFYILSFFVLRKNQLIWLNSVFIIGFVLSVGKNLGFINNLLFDYLPGLNKFRTPAMAVAICQFAVSIGGALALNKFVFGDVDDWKKVLKKSSYATLGLLSFILILIVFVFDFKGASDEYLQKQASWLYSAILEDRSSFAFTSVFKALFISAISVVVLALIKVQKLSPTMGVGVLIIVLLLDLFVIDKSYLNDSNFEDKKEVTFRKSKADKYILRDKGDYRVFNMNNAFNEAQTSYFHQSVGGYHGAKMRRYQDVISNYLSGQPNSNILQMLNVKYALGKPNEKPQQLSQNDNSAWLVENIIHVSSPDEELKAIGEKSFVPANVAILDNSKFKLSKSKFNSKGSIIKLKSKDCNELVYECDIKDNSFGVFSEIYYPEAWSANAQGQDKNIVRVNYLLRGVELQKGKYDLIFKCESPSFSMGGTISLISSWLCAILLLVSIGMSIWDTKKSYAIED